MTVRMAAIAIYTGFALFYVHVFVNMFCISLCSYACVYACMHAYVCVCVYM